MRYTGARGRQVRREGQNLFGNPKYDVILQKRPNRPGFIPVGARPPKLSEFGKQLREKQKMKRMYGLSEKQMRRLYSTARLNRGNTGVRLMQLAELRLDNVIYRSGFAATRPQARQFTTHGQFIVNGKRTDVPSFRVKPGDKIEVREVFSHHQVFTDMPERAAMAPKWFTIDAKNKTITIDRLPEPDEVEQTITIPLIIEFYSR